MQHRPRITPRVMPIIKTQNHSVIPHRPNLRNIHVLLPMLQNFLTRRMPLHLRARRIHTQVFARQAKRLATIEFHFENVRCPMQRDAARPRRRAHTENSLVGTGTGGPPAICASRCMYCVPKLIEPMPANSYSPVSGYHFAFGSTSCSTSASCTVPVRRPM